MESPRVVRRPTIIKRSFHFSHTITHTRLTKHINPNHKPNVAPNVACFRSTACCFVQRRALNFGRGCCILCHSLYRHKRGKERRHLESSCQLFPLTPERTPLGYGVCKELLPLLQSNQVFIGDDAVNHRLPG